MKTKLFIFDYAGTLVDIKFNYETYNRATELIYYEFKDIRSAYNNSHEFSLSMRKKWLKYDNYANNKGIELPTYILMKNYFFKEFNFNGNQINRIIKILSSLDHESILIDGVVEVLKEIKSQGHKIALFSNNILPFPRTELINFGIYHYFDYIKVSCEGYNRKPSNKVFEEIMNNFSINSKILFQLVIII